MFEGDPRGRLSPDWAKIRVHKILAFLKRRSCHHCLGHLRWLRAVACWDSSAFERIVAAMNCQVSAAAAGCTQSEAASLRIILVAMAALASARIDA